VVGGGGSLLADEVWSRQVHGRCVMSTCRLVVQLGHWQQQRCGSGAVTLMPLSVGSVPTHRHLVTSSVTILQTYSNPLPLPPAAPLGPSLPSDSDTYSAPPPLPHRSRSSTLVLHVTW
jgi:hypothetical protein